MKLRMYRRVAEGFDKIRMDSGCGRCHYLDKEQEVPEHWTVVFIFAEGVLAKAEGKTISDLGKSYECVEPDCPVKELIYLPQDDSDIEIMQALGFSGIESWAVRKLFYEFFDGELGKVFLKETPKC